MHDPDRIGEDTTDEAASGEGDRQRTGADDERLPAANPADSRRTDPPDLPTDWVPV